MFKWAYIEGLIMLYKSIPVKGCPPHMQDAKTILLLRFDLL